METTITTNTEFRVYVACLSSYNNGILHGAWCDAVDADDLNENIQEILKCSPMHDAEEWAIHDYEGFGSLYSKLGENPNIENLCKLGEALQKILLGYNDSHGLGADLLAEFISEFGLDIDDIDDVMSEFENRFQGVYDTFEDYAEQLFDECWLHAVPDDVKNYIDYEKFASDLSWDYTEISTGDGNVAVFCNH